MACCTHLATFGFVGDLTSYCLWRKFSRGDVVVLLSQYKTICCWFRNSTTLQLGIKSYSDVVRTGKSGLYRSVQLSEGCSVSVAGRGTVSSLLGLKRHLAVHTTRPR